MCTIYSNFFTATNPFPAPLLNWLRQYGLSVIELSVAQGRRVGKDPRGVPDPDAPPEWVFAAEAAADRLAEGSEKAVRRREAAGRDAGVARGRAGGREGGAGAAGLR